MTRSIAPHAYHPAEDGLHPSTVLLAHCLADGAAARWCRTRVAPAWMGDAAWQAAFRLAFDSAGLGPDALLARYDALTPDTWPGERDAIESDHRRHVVWLVWRLAGDVPVAVLAACPLERCAALARAAHAAGEWPPFSAAVTASAAHARAAA